MMLLCPAIRSARTMLIIILVVSCALTYRHLSTAFVVHAPIQTKCSAEQHSCRRIFGTNRPNFMTNKQDDSNSNPQKNQDENEDLERQFNAFLDTPLFDPDSEPNKDNWFANLVKNDYDTAEALYVGVIGIAGVIASQEMLRVVKYGAENYVPFGHGGGNLF